MNSAPWRSLRREPIFLRIEDRNLSGLEVVGERPVGAEVLFQLGQRKAGIDSQEGARGVERFEHHFAAAATAHPISKHAEQLARSAWNRRFRS